VPDDRSPGKEPGRPEGFGRPPNSGSSEPLAFLEEFLPIIGASFRLPRRLPADLEQGARALMAERGPWDARIPVEAIAAAPFPKLVVSGAHHPALDAICACSNSASKPNAS